MKERLDVLLVNLGYAPSREKAKAVIMSGCVYVTCWQLGNLRHKQTLTG